VKAVPPQLILLDSLLQEISNYEKTHHIAAELKPTMMSSDDT